MNALSGKRIVITGASRGLGEAMAVGFAREGAALALAARTVTDLDRVADRCRDVGAPHVVALPTDVTDADAVERLVDGAQDELGGLDAFVANAGVSNPGLTSKRYTTLASYDVDIVDELWRVNARGTWLAMRFALPALTPGGSFIAIGSETGRLAKAGSGFYAVAKSTIDVMVTIAADEMAEHEVRVNCLTPGGMVDTHLFGQDKMPDFLKELPMSHTDTDIIVPAAVWLVSDDSRDVTGAQLAGSDFNDQGVEVIHASLRTGAQETRE